MWHLIIIVFEFDVINIPHHAAMQLSSKFTPTLGQRLMFT